MKKLICKIFGHNWRWVLAYLQIRCIRCDDLYHGEIGTSTIQEWVNEYEGILKSI